MSLCLMIFQASQTYAFAKQTVINIFVHGTRPALRLLDHKKSPVRHLIHADKGLNLAIDLPEHYHLRKAALQCHEYDCQEFNKNHFYLWGWHSSNLRPAHRCAEGKKLYQAINALLKQYALQETGIIKLRLIGSSHGGNVVLNTLQCLPFDTIAQARLQTEVVLLGMPVQEATRDFINSEYVCKAYSFYSKKDWIQRIDMQKFHKHAKKGTPLLSSRMFQPNDDVIQIELKVNNKSISHGQYRRLFGHLPKMLEQVDAMQIFDQKNCALNLKLAKF